MSGTDKDQGCIVSANYSVKQTFQHRPDAIMANMMKQIAAEPSHFMHPLKL